MTGLARRGRYSQALNTLDTSAALAYRRYPNMEDGDIRFILDIVEGYRRDLRVFNQHSRQSRLRRLPIMTHKTLHRLREAEVTTRISRKSLPFMVCDLCAPFSGYALSYALRRIE